MFGEFSRYFILDTSIGHLRILWSAIKTPTATRVIIKESFFIFWAQNQQSCSEVSSYLNSLRLLLFSITTHNNVIGKSFAKKETDFRRQTSFSIREINAYKMLLTCFELLMDKRRKNNFSSRCILNKRTDFKSGYVSFSRLSFEKPHWSHAWERPSIILDRRIYPLQLCLRTIRFMSAHGYACPWFNSAAEIHSLRGRCVLYHDLFMVVDGACDWFPYSQSEI